MHSRGGLYTRAYVEELYGAKYNFDIHSLITLNTPHAGSQLANLVLDTRTYQVAVPEFQYYDPLHGPFYTYKMEERSLGDLFAFPVPEGDKELKNGAKVLAVNGDFIRTFNTDNNLAKLKKYQLPIHVVATDFKFCKLSLADCDRPTYFKKPAWMPSPSLVKKFNTAYTVYNFVFNQLPKAGDAFVKYIFDGENGDFIVPKSSMEVGMPYPYLTTHHELNISHTTDFNFLGAQGVTSSPVIQDKIINLLGQNVYDPQSNFTREGINPPRRDNGTELQYKFLDFWKQDSVVANARTSANELPEGFKFYMDRADSLVIYKAGDTISVYLMTSGVERAMVLFESENDDFWSISESLTTLEDTNVVKYVVPENYHGDFTITAFGVNNQAIVATETRLVTIQVPDSITLSKFYFTSFTEVIELQEMQTYNIALQGEYSDSTVRNFTYNPSVLYYLTDTTIAQFTGNTVRGLKQGKTYLVAVYGNKIDSLQFVVYENPNLTKTIFGDFYVSVTADDELIFDWNTLQEYRTESIVVEQSENGTDFSELFTVAAAGTSYEQTNYLFKDEFTANTKMYYRLRIIDEVAS